jgi:hypothetical protein
LSERKALGCADRSRPGHTTGKPALAAAIAAVNQAQKQLAAAQQPVDKLAYARAAATLREAAELRTEITRLRAAHKAEINRWVEGGGNGNRPAPPAELVPLERALGAIAAAAREAEVRFPAANDDFVRAAERLRQAARTREQAIWPAATEAAEPIFGELARAIAAAKSAEARLLSLVFGLREAAVRAGGDGNVAYAGAAKIEQRIIATRRRGSPWVNPAHGRSLIERLRLDAAAEL